MNSRVVILLILAAVSHCWAQARRPASRNPNTTSLLMPNITAFQFLWLGLLWSANRTGVHARFHRKVQWV